MPRRIVITGGPGGGKSTFHRNLLAGNPERLLGVPEVATLMFAHVFPQVANLAERRAVQSAIFHVQKNLEAVFEARATSAQILLCDRGTPDGGGYWPEGPDAFFLAMGSNWTEELTRYEAVLFLQSAACGGLAIHEGNHTRSEDLATAAHIDKRLYDVWSRHPRFVHVPVQANIAEKLAFAGKAMSELLDTL